MTTFVGKRGVETFRAISLKAGLRLFSKTGMKPNHAWTPTAMLKDAGTITGKVYKRGQYDLAVTDLEAWIHSNGTTDT